MNSLEGALLVASPYLQDSPFSRSVVFVVHHDEQGAVGVMLNRPATASVVEAIHEEVEAMSVDVKVNFGGPVLNSVVALQQHPAGVTACSEPSACEAALRRATQGPGPHTPLRIFIGHAGWQAGQLEAEVVAGVWMITPASPEHVFGDHEDLWAATVREIGRSVLRDALNIRELPADPAVN